MGLASVNIARTGIARTGAARLNAGFVVYDAEGGAVLSGDAYVTVNPYIGQAGGQADLSGDATVKADYIGQADGDAATSGDASFAPEYALIASGQADLSGDAPNFVDYNANASGQADLSGDATALADYAGSASGEATFDGTAPGFPEMIGPAGGEAIVSGSASPIIADYFETTAGQGGALFDGTAPVIFTIDIKGLPVFVRRFDGDVRLSLSQDGGIIKIRGGQPEMDDGLETAVNISLFSEGSWWANALAADGEEIGSAFFAALAAPLTNQARLDIIEAARDALAWMTESGIAQAVEITATIPAVGRLDLSITIRQPERAPTVFRYTVNWQNQRVLLQEAAA